MLRVKLFGPGEATIGDQPLTGFPNQLSCLLLSYLLLNRNIPLHRERLAAVFWSDYTTQVSRKHLRTALWRLRRNFGELGSSLDQYLEVANGSLSFLGRAEYWLDVEAFESSVLASEDIDGHKLSPDQVERLERAADLYVGDLLEGVYEDWCLYDRERLHLLLLNTLRKLMVHHGTIGNYEKALAYGQQILSRDNTREKVHRNIMWLHVLSGDRNAALAQYKLCANILRESLSIAPMEETEQLYRLILQEKLDPQAWALATAGIGVFEPAAIESDQPQAEQALLKLNRLQALLDETRSELGSFAQLISDTFLRSGRT